MPPRERFVSAAYATRGGDGATAARLLRDLATERPDTVAVAVAGALEETIARLWEAGWQPSDIVRVVRKQLSSTEVAVIRAVVTSQAVTYADIGRQVAPGWMAQVDELRGAHGTQPGTPYLLTTVDAPWPTTLAAAAAVMSLLLVLPQLPHFTDPPSAWRADAPAVAHPLPDDILSKVRALLAKAESTTFDAEAEALTAKAQELMTRHRIDRATIDAEQGGAAGGPGGRRIGIDDPYLEAKALLLAEIADANGCRSVLSRELGFCSVFGYPDELDATEELFTSLLVQANAALRREGAKSDRAGRSRTTRFRRSFLVAFATRIGQRLHEAAEATIAGAASDSAVSLLPVLAAREDATRGAFERAFPDLEVREPAATDTEGWIAGTVFGDRADITLQRTLPER